MSQKRDDVYGVRLQLEDSSLGDRPCASVVQVVLNEALAANLKPPPAPKSDHQFMNKFLLGLIAVGAVLLPLGQNAQAHWDYNHHYYRYHHAYWRHRYWHQGYWYYGSWHPGYWYPGPVTVVVAPY
jgi:hypothetical protein